MPTNQRAAQLLTASTSTLAAAIERHMPAGPYRDFTGWAFSADNPRRHEFLQTTGVIQLVNMNTTLLGGLLDDAGWQLMLRHAGVMNTYQTFEVISDNLALGLADVRLGPAAAERLTLVGSVNRAMIRALTPGDTTPAVLLLSGPARAASQRASGFNLSLAAAKHSGMAEEYARWCTAAGRAAPLLEELEYGLWAALIANIETCRSVSLSMQDTYTFPLLRQGLTDRYRAVERTLNAVHLPRLELAALGAESILVSPTLAFVAAVLAELVEPVPAYPAVIDDGSLGDLLADAALLVRLQNDIGTTLLRMAPVQQGALLNRIRRDSADIEADTADEALRLLVRDLGDDATFTRLHKDLVNSESNVALWHARRAADADSALNALADSLAYFAGLYAQHSARLAAGLADLDSRLGDRRVGTVIERFVRFHERMYANRHTDSVGEYAV